MAQKCVAEQQNAGRSEELKSSEQGGQTARSEATKCRTVRQKPRLHHEGLPRMRDGLIRRPTASELPYDTAHSGTFKSEEKTQA
jgi:hypothetical protein